jgi:hypothetical protein
MSSFDLFFEFTEHLTVLNRTPATINSYCDHVRLFLAGLYKDIKAVTARDMEAYVAGLFAYRDDEDKPYATC